MLDDLIGSLSHTRGIRKLSLCILHSARLTACLLRAGLCALRGRGDRATARPWPAHALGRLTGGRGEECNVHHVIKAEPHTENKMKLVERIQRELYLHCLSYYRLFLRSICCYLLMELSTPTARSNYGKPKKVRAQLDPPSSEACS